MPLSVLRVPCSFLLTQPFGHSGVPLSVLRVPCGFLLTDEREEVSSAPVFFRGSWALPAYDVHRADGSIQVQQAAAEGLCC